MISTYIESVSNWNWHDRLSISIYLYIYIYIYRISTLHVKHCPLGRNIIKCRYRLAKDDYVISDATSKETSRFNRDGRTIPLPWSWFSRQEFKQPCWKIQKIRNTIKSWSPIMSQSWINHESLIRNTRARAISIDTSYISIYIYIYSRNTLSSLSFFFFIPQAWSNSGLSNWMPPSCLMKWPKISSRSCTMLRQHRWNFSGI